VYIPSYFAGAVSWYDAFLTERNGKVRVYKDVLHIVRNPIKVVESRTYRVAIEDSRIFLAKVAGQWEDTSDLVPPRKSTTSATTHDHSDAAIRFALKHWVRRNSFLHRVASWVEQIEQLSTEPLVAWSLCMAAGFGPRCPALEKWRNVLGVTSKQTNSDINKTNGRKVQRQTIDWSTLLQFEPMYAAIAMKMSMEFGYQVLHDEHLVYVNNRYGDISTLQYQCGFDQNQKWDCFC
jgi:hypothetical protein